MICLSLLPDSATTLWVLKDLVYEFHEDGWDIGLLPKVEEWLISNVGIEEEDWAYEDYAMTSICFHFRDPSHAVLFKLTWC